MINYTIQIYRVRPEDRVCTFAYIREGYPTHYRSVNQITDFSEENLMMFGEQAAQQVVKQWDLIDKAPVVDVATLEGTSRSTQVEVPVEFVPAPTTDEARVAKALERIASARWERESKGYYWTNAQGDEYVFDTSTDSQARFTSAITTIQQGARTDGAVWKCGKIQPDYSILPCFLPLTNAELEEVAAGVSLHVQHCFDVEAACVATVLAGDLDVDYATEYMLS